MPPRQAAMLLRMPDRVYLSVQTTRLADTRSIPAAHERPRGPQSLARKTLQALRTASSVARRARPAPVWPILIQPGKPIATDIRTLRLPSLLYLSESKLPAPPAPVAPGAKAPPEPALGIPAASTLHPPAPAPNVTPTLTPAPLVTAAKAIVPPALPAPSAWSLVLHGEGGEGLPKGGKTESGSDVSVLAVGPRVPKAGELVEVPPVNQPVAAGGGTGASESTPEPHGERRTAAAAVNAGGPSGAGNRNGSAEEARGQPADSGSGGKSHTEAQSGAGKSESQTAAGISGSVRSRGTPLGRVKILDLPGGAQRWQFPSGGAFDVVIVQPSPDASMPDAGRLLTGRPVQTVYLTLGTEQDWVLQYCLPAATSMPAQSGMVVTLGPQPKLDAPFIQQAVVPPPALLRSAQPALFQAMLGVNGRFARLRPVTSADYASRMELLPYLEQWQFRPAKMDGVPAEIEVLLLVPSSTLQ